MQIQVPEVRRWIDNTLATAKQMGLETSILDSLKETGIKIIPTNSGSMNFGFANYQPPSIEVYQSNPSKYFPAWAREIWNQSGIDHELIGHIYNHFANNNESEMAARAKQVQMAQYRGQRSLTWRIAARAEPLVRQLKPSSLNWE
jgi:hypothetical protein